MLVFNLKINGLELKWQCGTIVYPANKCLSVNFYFCNFPFHATLCLTEIPLMQSFILLKRLL